MELSALRGVIGIFALLALAFFLSKDRKAINWRTVGFAFSLQILLGAFVLYVPFGKDVLGSVTNGVQQVINSAQAGIRTRTSILRTAAPQTSVAATKRTTASSLGRGSMSTSRRRTRPLSSATTGARSRSTDRTSPRSTSTRLSAEKRRSLCSCR